MWNWTYIGSNHGGIQSRARVECIGEIHWESTVRSINGSDHTRLAVSTRLAVVPDRCGSGNIERPGGVRCCVRGDWIHSRVEASALKMYDDINVG